MIGRRDWMGAAALGALLPALATAHPAATAPGAMTAADYAAARRFVETGFGRIAVVERGKGRAALFLHGFPLNGFQWRGVLGHLSSVRRCIAPDLLALGHTEVAPGADVGPDTQVAMLVALLDRLGVDSADVVANDSGGAVAQLLAVRYPQRVRSLLLTNCDTEIECPSAALQPVIEMAHAGTFVERWLAAWVADRELARGPTGLGGLCYADPSNPSDEAIASYLAPLVATPLRRELVHRYAIALEPNVLAGVEERLRRSRIALRILWGDADTIFSTAGAHYLHAVAGNSRGVRMVPGAKLFWPEERPQLLVDEAMAFWKPA